MRDLLVWSAATSVCATPGLWRDAFVLLEGMRQTTATWHNIGVILVLLCTMYFLGGVTIAIV